MTVTSHTPPRVIDVLQRADQRWARRHADEPATAECLKHLATFLQPLVESCAATSAEPIDNHELTQLREQVQAATSATVRVQAELDQAHAELDRLRAAHETANRDNQVLADQIAALGRERDQLAEQLQALTTHRCRWEWPGPDQPVKDCSCGRPYPRHHNPFETEPVVPDREPWAELFDPHPRPTQG